MGMSKEELKEMIDNVIVSNGKGQITADVLNLVLNNIAENAGGGSIKVLFFIDRSGIDDPEFFEPFFNHNSEIYNKLLKQYGSLMQIGPNDANGILSNIVDTLNDSFFKIYNIFEDYYPGEGFSAYTIDVFLNGVEEDSESDELVVKFFDKNRNTEYALYPNGELKMYGNLPS